jgi:hypothetical protein
MCERRRVRFVPSSGFGYPLDGLLPAKPHRPYFVPTALLGLNPSKRSPLAGWCRVSATTAPTYCLSRAFSTRDKHESAGHTGRSFWVPVRRESLAPRPVLGANSTGCSLGLSCLPGLTGRATSAEISLSLPSHAFGKRLDRSPQRPRVSIGALRA